MLTSRSASNWVDRGESPGPKVRRVLAHYLAVVGEEADAPWLADLAGTVLGMVAADASEVQVAAYLRSIAAERGRRPEEIAGARLVAIAVWHIAKAADVRERAERVLEAVAKGELRPGARRPAEPASPEAPRREG